MQATLSKESVQYRQKAYDLNLNKVVTNFCKDFSLVVKNKNELQTFKSSKLEPMEMQMCSQKNKIDSLQTIPHPSKLLVKGPKFFFPKCKIVPMVALLLYSNSIASYHYFDFYF